MAKFQIAGTDETPTGKDARYTDFGIEVRVKAEVIVGGARSAGSTVTVEADKDDVVEFEMEGGATLWLRSDEVSSRLGLDRGRSADDKSAIVLPTSLPQEGDSRGLGDWIIKGLRVLNIDLSKKTAHSVALALEKKAMDPHPGLGRWDGHSLSAPDEVSADGKPWLLFLHGTASNTMGSFGDLPKLQPGIWRGIENEYRHHILAFEHRSLTESPIVNALDIVEALPTGIELHLVSHSRGGLIGELLGRGRLTDESQEARQPFDDKDLRLFDAPGYEDERKALSALGTALVEKQIKVTRFVRVACPARGTSLMGGRLDRWLNLIFDVASLALGGRLNPVTSGLLGGLRALVQATVKERTDPKTLPGLAAMSPEFSPLLQVLNRQQVVQQDDLRVIAGDIEPSGVLRRLAIWFADLYFGRDHDLVVDTLSMDGGAKRDPALSLFVDRGKSVSHFNYFSNNSSASNLSRALTSTSEEARAIGLELGRAAETPMPELGQRGADELPIVFVLPGISGSHLEDGSNRIWIDLFDLAIGGVSKLAMSNKRIKPGKLIGLYYGDLCKELDRDHEVHPWAYDWRRSIRATATDFAGSLWTALETSDQPVRIVAHSMGGLVARTAFAQDSALWQAFKDRTGSRLVMLGTPNGGSFSIPMMLLGRNRFMRYLALLDFTNSVKDHQAIVAGWPGVLQMLPANRDDLFKTTGWNALIKADEDPNWARPSNDVLTEARAFRKLFDDAPVDPKHMAYIAGQADTYADMTIEKANGKGKAIRFSTSPEGDGQVLWSTGIPDGINAWYTHAVHGDLARHRPAFAAIRDLLHHGHTDKLPMRPPTVSRALQKPRTVEREPIAVIPSEEQLLAAATGSSVTLEPVLAERRVEIDVTHGHLAFARHAVMVGHYIGDNLNGTEKVLDRRQSGRIADRLKLGLHPGAIGTYDVHLNAAEQPSGSVIVGLGSISDLASGALQQTVQRGFLALAASVKEEKERCRQKSVEPNEQRDPLGVSCVLVGTGEGVIALHDCVMAILRALKNANRMLGDDGFEHLEIIELIEQRAVGAWHAIRKGLQRAEFRDGFTLDRPIGESSGRQRQIGPDDDPLWWTPVTITAADDDLERRDAATAGKVRDRRALKYVAIAGRARAEASLVASRRSLVDRYVERMTQRQVEQGAESAARTLFELLWPNRLKEQSLDDRNIRLILDDSSAALPWEMMDDRRPWVATGSSDINQEYGPPVTRFGVIRQLLSMNYRKATRSADSNRALVIGDPRGEESPLQALPGAQKEAEAVAAILGERGYDVTPLIGGNIRPEDVISALFSQAWQIVHIAAHGVVDYAFPDDPHGERKTGVVLGGSMVLDAETLDQMPISPDLFFVNCCLLGTVDQEAENQHLRSKRPALASSVAVQLIKMGVRAVVAAGWEVGDEAAELFAGRFYKGLLDGRTYGEVTRDARSHVYQRYPSDSTWGAYQCYGHPDFALRSLTSQPRHGAELPIFASANEAMAAIEQIMARSEVADERDNEAGLEDLERIEERIASLGWLGQADLRATLARAYGAFNRLDDAIDHYAGAAMAEDATIPVRAIEQQLHLLSKRAGAEAKDPDKKKGALETIETSIEKLKRLIEVSGKTLERLSLVGSAYKRLAQHRIKDERTSTLDEAADFYELARCHGQEHGADNIFYPWSQELSARTAAWLRDRRRKRPDFSGIKNLPTAGKADDFWRLVLPADLRLLECVANRELNEKEQDEILDAYLAVWNHMGKTRELSSILDQIDFLTDMIADKAEPEDVLSDLSGQLGVLRSRLEQGAKA